MNEHKVGDGDGDGDGDRDGDGGGDGGERVEVEARGSVTVVRPFGEMDIVRAHAFRQALLDALEAEPRPARVVVDLGHLSLCDSSGLNALLTARNLAVEHGQSVDLAAPSRQFLRLLEMTGALELFTITPTVPGR
ncbi:STAS domain-containing protein [Streptomyces sp. NPDC127110]|uniref:STAS domain-containing protein n=1 Tax=Streptomyces sp. NPDC127110 TaxID=3345362 RepID=UPI00362720EA